MTLERFISTSVFLFLASIFTLWLFFIFETPEGELFIRRELEKSIIQIALITIIGGGVGYLFKLYENHQHASEKKKDLERQWNQALIDFQVDKIQRLVDVANTMRRVPVLLEAHRSARTYGEQMRAAIDARLEVHRIVHEIGIFGLSSDNELFSNWDVIETKLRSMMAYLVSLEAEFRDKYKEISELQRSAEKNRNLQAECWKAISSLNMMKDLLSVESEAKPTNFHRNFVSMYDDAITYMKEEVLKRQSGLRDHSFPKFAGSSSGVGDIPMSIAETARLAGSPPPR